MLLEALRSLGTVLKLDIHSATLREAWIDSIGSGTKELVCHWRLGLGLRLQLTLILVLQRRTSCNTVLR